MKTTFVERGSDPSWGIDVLCDGAFVGSILQSKDGRHHRYFQGRSLEVYLMDDHELAALKRRVAKQLQLQLQLPQHAGARSAKKGQPHRHRALIIHARAPNHTPPSR